MLEKDSTFEAITFTLKEIQFHNLFQFQVMWFLFWRTVTTHKNYFLSRIPAWKDCLVTSKTLLWWFLFCIVLLFKLWHNVCMWCSNSFAKFLLMSFFVFIISIISYILFSWVDDLNYQCHVIFDILQIKNSRGDVLQCSHYMPIVSPDGKPLPCVIYCHGNRWLQDKYAFLNLFG